MAHTPEQNRSSSSFFSFCFLLIWSTLSFPVGWWILILFPNSCIPNRISSNQITVHNKPMFLYGLTLNNINDKPCKKKKQNTTLEHQTWFILTQPPTRKKEKKQTQVEQNEAMVVVLDVLAFTNHPFNHTRAPAGPGTGSGKGLGSPCS